MRRSWHFVVLALLLVVLVLAGPAATWLQARQSWCDKGDAVDVLYVMDGADIALRVGGIVSWIMAGGSVRVILIPRSDMQGAWSLDDGRRLTVTEWTKKMLRDQFRAAGTSSEDEGVDVRVVSVRLDGTRAELASLDWGSVKDVGSIVAVATARHHIRRALYHTRHRLSPVRRLVAIPASPSWKDRAPWVVTVELLKLARDTIAFRAAE
ncbi:MAG: hypothetical protein QGH42_04305 [Kiritimatiellia bacterium]|nr:hypothetical protein [Kiritimatiellia bacterium]MDP7023458.1 hypothetical protein [Kiritimatiellia bacterium]